MTTTVDRKSSSGGFARMVLVAAAVTLLAWPGYAQGQESEDCPAALARAEKQFDLGLFEDVPVSLEPCLHGTVSRSLGLRVRSLLGRAYLQNDELEKARREASAVLRLDPSYEEVTSPRFAALVAEVRREEATTQVASVSKTNESLREAPATVAVVTGEEIRTRGYLDLEQLLHDLPGFDISRMNGAFYSNISQRGYSAAGQNDRNLLLVDGVEQNDLSFGTVFLSRQYALSNVDRVEVVYGPASTMYGASAYTGVVNIITKVAEATGGEGKRFGVTGQVTGGGYGGGSADVTIAGNDRAGSLAWTLTGNFQKSQERDLSALPFWDYSYANVDYKSLMHLSGTAVERAVLCAQPSPYIRCDADGIALTDEGERLVRGLDAGMVRASNMDFDDRATNWWVGGTVRLGGLTLGLQSWRSEEGTGSAYGQQFGGSTTVSPRQTSLYVKYSLPLDRLKVNVFSRYQQTSRERKEPELDVLHLYAAGFLNLFSLVSPCVSPRDTHPVDCAPAPPWVESIRLGSLSSQFRTEINGTWDASERIAAVAGVELVKSSIQSGYDQTSTGPGDLIILPLEAPQQIEHSDVAVYAQGSWKPQPSLKVVLAGRLTYNSIANKAEASGFGTLFTPRAAVIYSPLRKRLVLKAIYSEAFKDPTDAQKFGVTFIYLNAYRSNGLRPERVRNTEVSAGWEPTSRLSTELALYDARYSDVVAYGYPLLPDGTPVTGCFFGCDQWQNRDAFHIQGLQLTARYRFGGSELWGNYTRTDSVQTDPKDYFGNPLLTPEGERITEIRAHGIARNRANAGIDAAWGTHWRGGLRAHYVGARPAGPGTTLPHPRYGPVAGHTTMDAVVSYEGLVRGTTLQLIALNLFDKDYSDPAADLTNVPAVLQAGRTIHLRLIYTLR